jgi:hypothetical protein
MLRRRGGGRRSWPRRRGPVPGRGREHAGEDRGTIRKLAARYGRLQVCFEAGPTDMVVWQIQELGHACLVVAPSLIPKRSGERIKTNYLRPSNLRGDLVRLPRQVTKVSQLGLRVSCRFWHKWGIFKPRPGKRQLEPCPHLPLLQDHGESKVGWPALFTEASPKSPANATAGHCGRRCCWASACRSTSACRASHQLG